MTQYYMLKLSGERSQQEEGEMLLQSMGVDSYEVISADAIDNLKDGAFIWDCIDEELLQAPADSFELKAYFEAGERAAMDEAVPRRCSPK